jgi:hypothetical protein
MLAWNKRIRPHRKRPKQKFTPEEDRRLANAVREIGVGMWKEIAERMPKRTIRQCRDRWLTFLAPYIGNGPWTAEEEAKLKEEVERFGSAWRRIARAFPDRSEVNVRNRWQVIQRREIKETGRVKPNEQQKIAGQNDELAEWDLSSHGEWDFDGWPFCSS